MERELDALLAEATANKDGLDIRSVGLGLVKFGESAAQIRDNSKYISYSEVAIETYNILNEELKDRLPEGEDQVSLPDLFDQNSLAALKSRILTYFGRLPRTYEFHFRLPVRRGPAFLDSFRGLDKWDSAVKLPPRAATI
jgi:hypothetical protein